MVNIIISKIIGYNQFRGEAGFKLAFYVSLDYYVRVNDCPAGSEPPAGARNRLKATVKIRRNTLRHETDYTQKILI